MRGAVQRGRLESNVAGGAGDGRGVDESFAQVGLQAVEVDERIEEADHRRIRFDARRNPANRRDRIHRLEHRRGDREVARRFERPDRVAGLVVEPNRLGVIAAPTFGLGGDRQGLASLAGLEARTECLAQDGVHPPTPVEALDERQPGEQAGTVERTVADRLDEFIVELFQHRTTPELGEPIGIE